MAWLRRVYSVLMTVVAVALLGLFLACIIDGAVRLAVYEDLAGFGLAQKAAVRARKTGFAVELEPMSAAERRVIHMALADDPAVVSESSGEGKNRRVVVKPV